MYIQDYSQSKLGRGDVEKREGRKGGRKEGGRERMPRETIEVPGW